MKRIILSLIAIFLLYGASFACTSAIVTTQRSSEGVPLLWKHRDFKDGNTRVVYVDDYKYGYTAVVGNTKNYKRIVKAGINEKGFGVISLTTYSLPCASPEEYKACNRRRIKGSCMWNGVSSCATVEEFEEMLRTTKRSNKYNSNIAVADATGAVAYFEIWDLGYKRYDATERKEGFDVRTNFSFADTLGDSRRNTSTRRYAITMQQMKAHEGVFTPEQFIGYSRSYNSIKYGDVLASNERYYCASHTVPRSTSVGAYVLVCDEACPRMLVMNGHPVSSLAVPVYVQAKHKIPQCVAGDAMCRLSNDFIEKAYTKGKKRKLLQKEVVREVLAIKQPKIEMPKQMPTKIEAFNKKVDKLYVKHEKRVRKVLAKF